jgi:hypothetical protein
MWKGTFEEGPGKPCDVEPACKYLLYKNAKSVDINIIVYWEEGAWFRFWEWDKEVNTFPFKIKLQEIGKI